MAFHLVLLFHRLCVCLYWAQSEISFTKGFILGGFGFFSVSNFFSLEIWFFLSGSVQAFLLTRFFSLGFPLFACSGVFSGVYVFSPFVIQAAGIGRAAFPLTYFHEYSTGGRG